MNTYKIRIDYANGTERIDVDADTRLEAMEKALKAMKAKAKRGTGRTDIHAMTIEAVKPVEATAEQFFSDEEIDAMNERWKAFDGLKFAA